MKRAIALVLIAGAWLVPMKVFAEKDTNDMHENSVVVSELNDTTPPQSSSQIPQGSLSLVSYEIRKSDGSGVATRIFENDIVDLLITVADTRPEAEGINPAAYVNTDSFEPMHSGGMGNAKEITRISDAQYTLIVPVRYTGTNRLFSIDVSYKDKPLEMQSIPISLNQCVETIVGETETEIEEPVTVKGTGFVVKEVSYGEGQITAGTDFTLDVMLLATNGDYAVENTNVTLSMSPDISIASGSNVKYIGTIQPNQDITLSFELSASSIAENGSYNVSLQASGINANDGIPVNADISIVIPIVQPERMELSSISIPGYLNTAYDDGAGFCNIGVINKGKGMVYNVSITIIGTGFEVDDNNVYLGNMASGTENSAYFNLVATEVGNFSGTVIIEYEDSRGEVRQLTKNFTIKCENLGTGVEPVPIADVNVAETPTWPLWLAIFILGLFSVVLILKYRKKEKALRERTADDEGAIWKLRNEI